LRYSLKPEAPKKYSRATGKLPAPIVALAEGGALIPMPQVRDFGGGPLMAADEASRDSEVSGIFEDLRRPLFRYFLCAGLSREDADEGIQETFLRLHRHLRKDGERSNLRGWIFQVARNLARNQHKSARIRRTEVLDDSAIRDPEGSPEDQAIRSERMRRLERAIEILTPPQRECVLLRASGLRYREIAEVLGVSVSSVGEMVQRAAARLNEVL
jgi:RNA polymerase sigma-70 factor (ECF subfamily)